MLNAFRHGYTPNKAERHDERTIRRYRSTGKEPAIDNARGNEAIDANSRITTNPGQATTATLV